jgi:hypothetical protein
VVQGGEASVEFELDRRGYVQGTVLGFDWDDATRTMSWANIEMKSSSALYNWHSWDGWFDGYLDPGTYQMSVTEWTASAQGHQPQQLTIAVNEGQMGTQTIILAETGIPIPEFASGFAIAIVISSLALLEVLLRRPRRGHMSDD